MAKIYNNRNVDVLVPLPLGGEAFVEAGGELSTSDEHAEALLEQPDNWRSSNKKTKAQELAEEKGVPLAHVEGSGKEGRVLVEDVEKVLEDKEEE